MDIALLLLHKGDFSVKKRIAECQDLDKILKVFILMDDVQREVMYQIVLLLKQRKIEDVQKITSHVDIQALKENSCFIK